MAPVVVHTFDRVMMERFQSSSTEFSFKGKLQNYKILQEQLVRPFKCSHYK